MEFLFFSHILPPEWKTVCWCLVFAWLHKRLNPKEKKKCWRMGEGGPVQEPGIPSLFVFGVVPSICFVFTGFNQEVHLWSVKPAWRGRCLASWWGWERLWNSLLCVLRPLTWWAKGGKISEHWLTDRSQVLCQPVQCQVMWYQDDAPPAPRPDFFLSSILELANERCQRLQVDQSSIPRPG